MITQYQRQSLDHPIIKEYLFWHDEAWLDRRQLAALLQISESKLRRLLQRMNVDQADGSDHSEVFSVVKKRSGKQNFGDWVYQVRHYDTSIIRRLAKYGDAQSVTLFMRRLMERQR